MTNPVTLLIIFGIVLVLLFILFYPKTGFYWRLQQSYKTDPKILIEDILKKLYHAEDNGTKLSSDHIINSLNSSPKKILETISEMEDKELIRFKKGEIKLSETGMDYALRIIRVHRLWEKYLSEKTGFHKKDWHEIAEKMEHKLDSQQTKQLAINLGNPRFDPHGDPIPTETGEVEQLNGKPLPKFKEGAIGRIIHIEDEPEIIYKQILAEDLHIGSHIHIIEKNKKRIVFHSEGEEFILAPIVANNITISELKKEDISEKDTFRLSNLKEHEHAKIIGISRECRGEIRRRLLDLGFVMNTKIEVDLTSPMRNPRAYLVRDTSIAIRNEQAKFILIEKIKIHAETN
ncbi:DtxR family transcriptional regulator, Mn-dependent transcriptional regulator [Lutibacter oricola]|uniref:DtxR family transcriptional regulator, Mn-dependent transcriptional regulator n=1 Tax=Lutibacter oricola TaxID=762486 RepID=A0A1H2RUG0_9FLAO|nr:metal-dependent transcriptional regulator [Lutibacter oricola]SDW22820.1 DtxR family transcriptional regulator, Mn-dependent transcriptional regulator [Lutibacter oricola]